MHPVSIVIPTLNEAEAIGAVIREIPPAYAADIIVADSGSGHGKKLRSSSGSWRQSQSDS